MRTRLQPIHTAWARFPRVVRDLAAALGKRRALELEGDDTELDKLDHRGARRPADAPGAQRRRPRHRAARERAPAGKPAEGTIALRASHAGDQVDDRGQRRRPRASTREASRPRPSSGA